MRRSKLVFSLPDQSSPVSPPGVGVGLGVGAGVCVGIGVGGDEAAGDPSSDELPPPQLKINSEAITDTLPRLFRRGVRIATSPDLLNQTFPAPHAQQSFLPGLRSAGFVGGDQTVSIGACREKR